MRVLASYLMAGILMVLALDLVATPGGLGLAVRAWSAVPSGGATIQSVDRTGKGDRLNMSVTTIDKQQLHRAPSKMMDGCDPAFSPLSKEASYNFAGRCAV